MIMTINDKIYIQEHTEETLRGKESQDEIQKLKA